MLRWRWTLSLCSFSVVRFGVLWDSIAKLFQVPNSNNLGRIFVLCRGLQTTNFTQKKKKKKNVGSPTLSGYYEDEPFIRVRRNLNS
jgi:hypothetical protein